MQPAVDALAGAAASSRSRWPTSRRAAALRRARGFDCYVEQVARRDGRRGRRARGDLRRVVRRADRRRVRRPSSRARRPRWCSSRRCRRRGARRARAASTCARRGCCRRCSASPRCGCIARSPRRHDGVTQGLTAAARHGLNVLTHMFSPSRMARRVRLLAMPCDLARELGASARCRRSSSPASRARPRRARRA